MMGPLFPGNRVPSVAIKPRSDTLLHGLDDLFVLELDGIEPRSRAHIIFGRIGDIGEKTDPCPRQAQGFYDIDGQAPGVEVEHQIREDKEVVRGYFLSVV